MPHKNLKILTWFNFFTDFLLYAPIAIIYFGKIAGSYTLGMSIFSVITVSAAILEIPTGIFSDYIGRKKTVICGAIASVLFVTCYALANSYWILVVGAILEGLSRSFYSGNNNALLHATLAESKNEHMYEEYLGKTSSMFQIAATIAAISGSILAAWSFQLIIWLSVIPQLICLYLSFQLTEPSIQTKESGNVYFHLKDALSQFIHNKKLRLLSISSILSYGFGEATYHFRAAFFNTLWPIWALGFARSLSSISAGISFHFSGRVIKKFGHIKMLIFGFGINRVITSIFVLFPTVLSPVLLAATSLQYGILTVAENSLMQKEFTDKQRATMESLNSLGGNLFYALVALLIGFVADSLSPANAILLVQFCMLPVLLIYFQLYKNHNS